MHRSVLKDQKYDSGKNEHKTADGAIGARVEERNFRRDRVLGLKGKIQESIKRMQAALENIYF